MLGFYRLPLNTSVYRLLCQQSPVLPCLWAAGGSGVLTFECFSLWLLRWMLLISTDFEDGIAACPSPSPRLLVLLGVESSLQLQARTQDQKCPLQFVGPRLSQKLVCR